MTFQVECRCTWGECPVSDGVCDCSDPVVEVDVDELLEHEVQDLTTRGTPAQRAEIAAYLGG